MYASYLRLLQRSYLWTKRDHATFVPEPDQEWICDPSLRIIRKPEGATAERLPSYPLAHVWTPVLTDTTKLHSFSDCRDLFTWHISS